jgi:hypothetical protein
MTVTSGLRDEKAGYQRDVCRFYDERLDAAQKVAFVHSLLRRDMTEVRPFFERIEKLFDSLGEDVRKSPEYTQAIATVAADRGAREAYLGYERRQRDAALRRRMIALARTLGWLSQDEWRAEQVALVNDVLAGPMGFVEVDLVCSLNRNHELDGDASSFRIPAAARRR